MTQLLTIKEVAEKLQVKVDTIRHWQITGKIAYIKIGRSVRFRPEALEGWLNKRTVKAKS